MKKSELKAITAKGEDSRLQFKQDIRNADAWPQIDFIEDRDGCLFTATVHRKVVKSSGKGSVKTSVKTSVKILAALKKDENLTIPELALLIGVTERSIERNIKKLQEQGRLRCIGPARGGHWEVR